MSDTRKHVLVLDDDVLLAIDLSEQLANIGYEVVGPATSVATARALLAEKIDCAVIDVHLGSETSESIARMLQSSGTPFVVLTGYTDAGPDFPGDQILMKPVRFEELAKSLKRLLDEKE